MEGMILPTDETLEDRLVKLERKVGDLRNLNRAQRPLFALNIIWFSGEFDRLKAAFMIADGAKDIGQEVNIFLSPWTVGTSDIAEGWLSNGRSAVKKILAWVLGSSLDRSSPSNGNSGGRRKFFGRKRARGAELRELMDLGDKARKNGVRIYECGPPARGKGFGDSKNSPERYLSSGVRKDGPDLEHRPGIGPPVI